jgi:glycosyltransferase involved in cell wall biosynthesis
MVMPEIRLLEVRSTYKWGGGPDKTILLSAEQHDKSRLSVVVAYIRDVRDLEFQITEKARAKGLTFYEIEERGRFDSRVLGALRDIVVKHNINLIHSHDYKSDFFAYLVGRWMCPHPVRLLSTAHAWVILGLKGELYRRLDLLIMRRLDHLVAVSHATKAEMVAGGVPTERITVIHNAIDTIAWSPAQGTGDFRVELKLNGAFPVIGYVGRINQEKDLDTWLRAAALVARKYPAAKFVVVGDGRGDDTQSKLEQLAATLDIEQNLVFPGYRSSLQSVYSAFDIFMLSSRREGLPNCILEAMAMGLPVVTTDVAGAKELVSDQETGYVLPQGDVQGLGTALLKLADDSTLRGRLRQAGRARIESEFSFTNRLRCIEDLYERMLAGHTNRAVRSDHIDEPA